MDRQRFFESLCHGLTLCIDENANELTTGLVSEAGRPAVIKCLADLRDAQAKLRQVLDLTDGGIRRVLGVSKRRFLCFAPCIDEGIHVEL